MRIKSLLSVIILGTGITSSFLIMSNSVRAQTPATPAINPVANIQYPVSELGNCGSETACKNYCNDSAHLDACLSFAQSHNLMSADEIQMAKKFTAAGVKGPGGCTSQGTCQKYCDDVSHIDECVSFAEKNGMMSASDLAEAKKVQTAIKAGVKPPACGGKQACDKYCQDATHVEECMAFAKAAGFMTPEEAQNSDKVITAIKKGVKLPACRGSECDKYCAEPAHTEECIAFSEAAGFMTSEQAAISRKTGGKGPGGCVGKQCDAFCNDSANQETCFNFGKDNGLIPPDQLQKMEDGKKQFTSSLSQAPAKVLNCISGVVGVDSLEKFKNGTLLPSKNIGDKVGECFRQGMPPGGPGEGGDIPPAGQGSGDAKPFQPGPGNVNPGGQMMPQQSGPGECKTPEECQLFCTSNPDICKNFRPSGGPQQNEGDQNLNNRRDMMPGGQPGEIQGGMPEEFQNFIQGTAGQMMPGIQPGMPTQGQMPACPPGAQCGSGPNTPGQFIQGQPGTFNQNQPGSFAPGTGPSPEQQMMFQQQPMQPGAQQGGTPPPGVMMQPGTNGGPATQQFQQPQQQFQSPPPPPADSGMPPPPPAGGSLIQSIQSFFGF